ncbi:MAG: hypothetical protein LBE02_03610 [Spirochaetaceae bacterium]|nr:hypothetical protein [Spirochaetaceae bacterium]
MNQKSFYAVIFLFILAITALAIIFYVTQLEWRPAPQWVEPSAEAETNPLLALERWLDSTGIGYRKKEQGNIQDILKGAEQTVFIQASRFDWSGAGEGLTRWIAQGGFLVISQDYPEDTPEEELEGYLETLGLVNGETLSNQDAEDAAFLLDAARGYRITEKPPPVERIAVLWRSGGIRLVSLYIGKGRLTVTGNAYFLNSSFLKDNADLAWDLLLNPGKTGGVLFIQKPYQNLLQDNPFFGRLFTRGNPAALFIAAGLLVFIGFWMVIPLFGRSKPVPELPGKALRERFLAEGRFLKKYRAVDRYLEIYRQALQQHRRILGNEPDTAASMAGQSITGPEKEGISKNRVNRRHGRDFLREQKEIIRELFPDIL